MADTTELRTEDAAEMAYATAVALTSGPAEQEAVEFPPKAKRERKPRAVAVQDAVVAEVASEADVPAKLEPVVKAEAPVILTAKPRAARKPAPSAKPVPAAKPVKAPARKRVISKKNAAPKIAAKKTTKLISDFPKISQLKDKIMATTTKTKTTTKDFTAGIKDAIADVQGKAKATFEKSTAAFGDVNEFAKGNVEAIVESGKILAAGLQDLGTAYVAEGRSTFETITADVKELAAVKSPTDFFKLQSDLVRRNFDSMVALGSKNSEAMLKLANEAFAPISGRVSLAVEKVKKAA